MVKCLKCNKEFENNSLLGSHLRVHKIKYKDYLREYDLIKLHKCKMCDAQIPLNRIYCSNKCKFSDIDYKKNKRIVRNDKTKSLQCKLDGRIINDVKNTSGFCTRYLREIHNIDTKDYMQYYDIIDNPKLSRELFHCPIGNCDWTTVDLNNSSGWFTIHLRKKHGLTPEEFCKLNPEYKKYWVLYFKNVDYQNFIKENERNRIQCLECGEWFKKISNSHLKDKHNMTIKEYKEKHEVYLTTSKTTSGIQSELTFEYNLKHGGSLANKKSSYEQNFETNLIKSNIRYFTPFLYKGKNYDFYLPELNLVIEIDGVVFHQDKLIDLSFSNIKTAINDYQKDILSAHSNSNFNFYRLRYIDHNFNNVNELYELIKNIKYNRDYTILFDQKIINKEYIERYVRYKGMKKTKSYSNGLLKFFRIFNLFLPTEIKQYQDIWNDDIQLNNLILNVIEQNQDLTIQNLLENA